MQLCRQYRWLNIETEICVASLDLRKVEYRDNFNIDPWGLKTFYWVSNTLQIQHFVIFSLSFSFQWEMGISLLCFNSDIYEKVKEPDKEKERENMVSKVCLVQRQLLSQPNSTSTRVGSDKVVSWTTHPPTTTTPPHLNF